MVILDSVKGHEQLIKKLENAQFAGRFASTHILVGTGGIGKKRVALGLAQNLLCEKNINKIQVRACGNCGSCKRVQNQQHESMLFIQPEKNQIKIEQARSILQFCHFKAIHSATIVIIDKVEMMNPQTANALLKILEEPAKQVYFFMICGVLGRLLPTLRSRAQIWHFKPLEYSDMKTLTSLPDWVISASQGSMETAAMLSNNGDEEIKPHIMHWLQNFPTSKVDVLLEEGRKLFSDKEKVLTLARLWQQMIRDAIVLKISPHLVIHQDSVSALGPLSNFTFLQLKQLFAYGQEMESSVFRHWDTQLMVDHLVYESYKCLRGSL
ncbi:MAG: hypothetical protein H6625_10255 [Bdellovibrionaceae bacterium]|nr:hypothetical protein [Pseudobdellovibrionaceae bacterium]